MDSPPPPPSSTITLSTLVAHAPRLVLSRREYQRRVNLRRARIRRTRKLMTEQELEARANGES